MKEKYEEIREALEFLDIKDLFEKVVPSIVDSAGKRTATQRLEHWSVLMDWVRNHYDLLTEDVHHQTKVVEAFREAVSCYEETKKKLGSTRMDMYKERERLQIERSIDRLRNVASYAIYSLLCLVLSREAAENIRRPDKAVSPTYFNT